MALNITTLEQSFEQVKPQAKEFISSFYSTLFTDYPAAQSFFVHTDMVKQQTMLLNALVYTVENLRQPEALVETLKGLGSRHMQYGALPEHYPLVGKSLLKTFATYLGPDWTPELEQAWSDAYALIAEVMLEGADYPPEVLSLQP